MQNLTFRGTDASLETSLFEYGVIVSNEQHEDGSGTHFCVYKQEDMVGTGHISPQEINNLLMGNEWASKEDLKSFYSYVGSNEAEYLNNDLVHKLADLIQYYGSANIMGTDYSPISDEDAIEKYLND